MGNRAITGLMLLLVVATVSVLGWRYLQPLDEKGTVAVTELKKIASATDETSATLKTMAADVKRIAEATEKCCAGKKVAPALAKKVKKKKVCATPAPPKVKQEEEKPVAPPAPAITPKEEEKKPEPKVEAKKCSGADLQLLEDGRIICAPSSVTTTPAPVLPKVAEMKCVSPNIRQLMDDGSIACVQPPATPVAQAPAPPAPVTSNVCTDMGLNGLRYVPMVDEHGRAYCGEEVNMSFTAVAQYVICPAVGAVAGFQRGGMGGAAVGATSSTVLTYAGRRYGGENWGWVGCVPGTVVIGFDAIKAATRTRTKTITINTSGGTTGGGTISGATTGGSTIP